MDEIDCMDMPGFFRIRAWKASREAKQKGPRRRYIDEVWKNMRPGAWRYRYSNMPTTASEMSMMSK